MLNLVTKNRIMNIEILKMCIVTLFISHATLRQKYLIPKFAKDFQYEKPQEIF